MKEKKITSVSAYAAQVSHELEEYALQNNLKPSSVLKDFQKEFALCSGVTSLTPDYTKKAIANYSNNFKDTFIRFPTEALELFQENYPDISFSSFVNETLSMLLEKEGAACSFGPGSNVDTKDLVRKHVLIAPSIEKGILDKFGAAIEAGVAPIGTNPRWVQFTGLVTWAVTYRLHGNEF